MMRSQSVDVKNFSSLQENDIMELTKTNTKCNSLTVLEEETKNLKPVKKPAVYDD